MLENIRPIPGKYILVLVFDDPKINLALVWLDLIHRLIKAPIVSNQARR